MLDMAHRELESQYISKIQKATQLSLGHKYHPASLVKAFNTRMRPDKVLVALAFCR